MASENDTMIRRWFYFLVMHSCAISASHQEQQPAALNFQQPCNLIGKYHDVNNTIAEHEFTKRGADDLISNMPPFIVTHWQHLSKAKTNKNDDPLRLIEVMIYSRYTLSPSVAANSFKFLLLCI